MESRGGSEGEVSEHLGAFCPYYHHAVELIGRRWTGAIIRALLTGVERFTDFVDTIPGLSDRMLSERLKELEAEDIVRRTVIPEMPVRIEYHLTPKGHALASVVEAISAWSGEWLAQEGAPATAARGHARRGYPGTSPAQR